MKNCLVLRVLLRIAYGKEEALSRAWPFWYPLLTYAAGTTEKRKALVIGLWKERNVGSFESCFCSLFVGTTERSEAICFRLGDNSFPLAAALSLGNWEFFRCSYFIVFFLSQFWWQGPQGLRQFCMGFPPWRWTNSFFLVEGQLENSVSNICEI
mgnify:CR=1 FL=1